MKEYLQIMLVEDDESLGFLIKDSLDGLGRWRSIMAFSLFVWRAASESSRSRLVRLSESHIRRYAFVMTGDQAQPL